MSNQAQENSPLPDKPLSKSETITTPEQVSPEKQKLLNEALDDLASPRADKTPMDNLQSAEVTFIDHTTDKYMLKGHISKNVLPELKSEKAKLAKDQALKDLVFPPRLFEKSTNGILEYNYPPEQPTK